MKPLPRDLRRAWRRTFAVQGLWNYGTLIGPGLAYALLPLLRRIYAGDPVGLEASVRRHLESFNAHPYLSAVAVGALARMELDGAAGAEIARFRTALRGPLGTLGDRTIWAEWRPLCLLVAIVMFGAGVAAWACALAFLLLYNGGHVWVRYWGFRRGWEHGRDVGRFLREFPLERLTDRLWPVTMFLLGAATVLLGRAVVETAGRSAESFPLLLVAGLTALPAFRWPNRFGRLAIALLLAIPIVWTVLAVAG
ncbi:MAG: PTS system mannose/fructose/sorbose family transporter subunit IID [Gemmatimonadota bacterium]